MEVSLRLSVYDECPWSKAPTLHCYYHYWVIVAGWVECMRHYKQERAWTSNALCFSPQIRSYLYHDDTEKEFELSH